MLIPKLILKQLYTFSSLKNVGEGLEFSIKNRLTDVRLTGIDAIMIAGNEIPGSHIFLDLGRGELIPAMDISKDRPIDFPLRKSVSIFCSDGKLSPGKYALDISFMTDLFGKLSFSVEDSITEETGGRIKVPYDAERDYEEEAIRNRQKFIEQFSRVSLRHLKNYSFDPQLTRGNIENFTGVAQIPLGFAGPVKVDGEYANGFFLVPLATTEGTLVASYNRGIKAANLSGGIKVTVQNDSMQRAPVFVFTDARDGKKFVNWVYDHMESIRKEAEQTSHYVRLQYVDPFVSNKFVFLRFNYSTGDAAGQNMVGRATFAACSWITEHYQGIQNFYLESNFATDKKSSQVNVMRTRGKRVTAEVTYRRDVLIQYLRAEPENLFKHHQIATIGAFFSGANNNGAHSPNAIAAMFIATGQDVANVAESSAAILYTELTGNHDLYVSLTIPSLIVASYGGGTGLATQKECLEIMQCYGEGKVNKLAEIVTATALAGEISLGAAISSMDWVSSHEKYGRNR